MKTTLIRILSIMTLATSMSAFAMSEPAKGAGADPKKTHSNETTVSMLSVDEPKSQQGTATDNDKSRKQQIEQQNKEWLHNLQGVYGG